jgi:CBS domain-containing protein
VPQALAEAATLMYERGVKRLPVVDSAGRLAGIVSRIDVLSVFTRPDGQIRDDVVRRVIAGANGDVRGR